MITMEQKRLNRVLDFKLPTAILAADLSADAETMVAGCMDGVYEIQLNNKSYNRIGQHESYVSGAKFISRHGMIVSAGYDGHLQWFDLQTKQASRKWKAHDFWSWDLAVSPDQTMIASVTGQYLAGGYKYEPAPQREPSVRLIAADTGASLHDFPHVPSVQAVAFSNDSRFVAAGNLMGEVRVWDCQSGQQVTTFTTPDLTSWGIIKSHCYLGGIFAMAFTPDDQAILICGMGDMRDPMAGNGKQLWQRWDWKDSPAKMIDQTHAGESGEGLMESLAIHPSGEYFAMGGRLRGGDWNAAIFDMASGKRIGSIKSGYRITDLAFTPDGSRLVVVGTQGQPRRNDAGEFPKFGRVEVYEIQAGNPT